MEAQHTPGPWYAEIEPTGINGVYVRFTIRGEEKHSITSGQSQEHLGDGVGIEEGECVANARLIAAAPDLLEACKKLNEWDEREKDHAIGFMARIQLCEEAFTLMRAAMTKATWSQS